MIDSSLEKFKKYNLLQKAVKQTFIDVFLTLK